MTKCECHVGVNLIGFKFTSYRCIPITDGIVCGFEIFDDFYGID